PPEEGAALQPRRLELELAKELREVVAVAMQPLRVVVARKEFRQLVPEHRDAARLHADDRDAGPIPPAQLGEALPQIPLSEVEEPVVVERAAAEAVLLRHHDPPTGGLDRLDGGDADVGVEVVVEGVREEHDLW